MVFRSLRSSLAVAGALVAALTLSSAVLAQEKGKADQKGTPPVELKQVLVFPTDAKGGVSEQIADDIVSVVKSRLSTTKLYEPIQFLSSIPTVRLALTEQQIAPADIRHPFDSDAKLKKLSGVTGYNYVVVSSIDDYQYDASKNQVDLVISVRMIDYTGAKAVVRSAAQSATSPANAGNAKEATIASDLARSLTDKLMTSILTPKPATQPK